MIDLHYVRTSNGMKIAIMMEETRFAHRVINYDIFAGDHLKPEFKKINPRCNYLGVDVVSTYAELAKRHCDKVVALDIEAADEGFFSDNAIRDCWIRWMASPPVDMCIGVFMASLA